jgi:hypothetical protein
MHKSRTLIKQTMRLRTLDRAAIDCATQKPIPPLSPLSDYTWRKA